MTTIGQIRPNSHGILGIRFLLNKINSFKININYIIVDNTMNNCIIDRYFRLR